jgi:prepilin-type N-terminal cleavage/methylation domain-containing protein
MIKHAFTLAEVLITLGIIGLVSVLTIPTLSSNIRGNRLKSQFNKAYADLNQAARAFYQDNDMGVLEYEYNMYDLYPSKSTVTLRKFMSYFKGAQDSTYEAGRYDSAKKLTNLSISGKTTNYYICDESNLFLDSIGRTYAMDNPVSQKYPDYTLKICVDINGNNKPNKWGVDRFAFVFTDANSVVPYTSYTYNCPYPQLTDEKAIKLYCSSTSDPGHTCAYFALKNINPEGKGDYWHDFLRGK